MAHPLAEDLDHVLNHTQGLWDELRGARLFITGGTGFFGKWLLESFVWANRNLSLNAQALVLTRSPETFRSAMPHLVEDDAIQLHEGDVREFAFPDGRYSHVIHAATPSLAQLNYAEPEAMLEVIIQGTWRTLRLACRCGAAKFLLASSGAIYGRQPSELTHLGEDYAGAPDHLDPHWVYGEGKRVAEQLCAIHHRRHGLETKIARGFAFVGPYLPLSAHYAIGNFLHDGLAGGPIRVAGDGMPYRSYLYAADLAIWLWTILLRGQPLRPYNVGAEEDLTIADLARKIADYFGTDVHVAQSPVPGKAAERYVPATKRASEELGLKTWIGLDEAIERTARWHRGARGEGRGARGESV